MVTLPVIFPTTCATLPVPFKSDLITRLFPVFKVAPLSIETVPGTKPPTIFNCVPRVAVAFVLRVRFFNELLADVKYNVPAAPVRIISDDSLLVIVPLPETTPLMVKVCPFKSRTVPAPISKLPTIAFVPKTGE